MSIISNGLVQIRKQYPCAHSIDLEGNNSLIIIPSVELPKGWNSNICTILFITPYNFPAVPPDCFWVNFSNLKSLDGRKPKFSSNLINIPDFPRWDNNVIWFRWVMQAWRADKDNLLTYFLAIKNRLKMIP